SPYTLVNVTGNRTVTAKFSNQFSITITDPPNGDISPSGNQTVTYGDSMQFFVTPDVGYEIDSIFVNGVYYGNTSPFTVYNITSNLTITVKFRLKTYSIAVTQPANGSISPTGPVSVSHGSNVQFTFTPNATYHIDSIFVDGVYVGNTSPYTITNVTSNRSVSAKYSNQFSITITDPPNGDISPSGNQTVTYGDSMQFFVTPDVGYEIDSIFVNGVYYGNTSPFTVYNITSNLTITVKFRLKTYSITVTQPANGSISPSSTVVNHGDSLQLTFTPNATYHIDSIFVDGNYVGNSSTYTLQNITGAHTVTAKYSNQFSVTVNEPTNGDISPSGNVDVTYGDSLQFFVTPDEGYEIDSIFVNGAYYGNTSPFTVYNVTSDLTINVTFRLKSYTISVTQPANGSISPAGAVSVTHGSNKQFQFFPDATYHIDSILVDGSYVGNTTPYVVQNVTSNHTVTAVYSNQFSVTVNEPTNGDISPSGNLDVTYGDSLQFFVTPDEGYEIDSIFVNDVYNGNTSPFTVYNITSNLNVRVKFKLKTYSISVTQPQNGGISPTGPVSVTHGGSVLFTFTPNTGYALDSIFVNGAYVGNSSTYNLQNINGNKTVTAKYKKLTYQVSIATPQNGNISPSGNLTVEYGDSIQFSITPNTGYEIDSIFVNGVYVGNSSTYVLRNITGTSSVAVKFRIKTYAVTVTTPTNGTISPSGTLSVTHGDSRVFTITPNTGYHIDSIFVDGVYVGNTSPYTLSNITGNRTLFVKFKLNTYTITVLSTTNGGITPTGPITANYGSNQQFTISPNTGYHIDSVFVDGSYVGNTSPYTITNVISNRTISAKFAINQYTITVATPTNGTISPTGPVTTNYGTSQTFTITPNTGYHIVNVTINGEVNLGAVTQHTFTNIASNYSLAATFEINGYVIVASAGTNGSIAPSGNVNVNYGSDQNFTITSNEGYHIDSVFVDGEYIGDDAEYEFSALDTNHTISVLFAINQYTLTINVDSTGSVQISPEQELYDHGTTVTLTG
ncbi:MAG: hypothetical protein KGZ58_03165, partial [Ignavibacteriales bacterium]|nr:hypothetical protein [Ignavibacteriales bacterium]